MSEHKEKKIPAFLKTVYLSNREIRLILAGLYSLNMPEDEVEGTLWKKLLFEKLHKKKLDERRTLTKIKKLSKSQKEVLLLKAQTEFGDYALYEVKNGTHGLTLYVYPDLIEDASRLRKAVPLQWNNLFTIVTYIDTFDRDENN